MSDPNPCANPIEEIAKLFTEGQARRIAAGQNPAERAVFRKLHGVAYGTFEVHPPAYAPETHVGVFAEARSYPVWVRFSSDTTPTSGDIDSTLGIGIKLFGVPGQKVLEREADATTHDFVLQNHDVFFVKNAQEMCEFTYAGLKGEGYPAYLAQHPEVNTILTAMRKEVGSVLSTDYWSVIPFKLGAHHHAKYKIVPVGQWAHTPFSAERAIDPNYLEAVLVDQLGQGVAAFHFYVQLQKPGMEIDNASQRWSESESEPIHVATLTLPQQDIHAPGQANYGQNLAYTPWHALPEHEPVGSIAEARKVAYNMSADLRRNANGEPIGEPVTPRPADLHLPMPVIDNTIVSAKIHPAIGVARVGNSPQAYYLMPEVPYAIHHDEPDFYHDEQGALKRQGVRFRIYGYNRAGQAVRELTAEEAHIEWTVHVANKKAAWYNFEVAMDIPEAMPVPRRNANFKGEDRAQLVIDPGSRTISGADHPPVKFDNGKFVGGDVYLGEIFTDREGRLIFLGGHGISAPYAPDKTLYTFGNNDGWYDDTSDGPVKATVTLKANKQTLPCESAWVITAPPNYAPDVFSISTMYDLMIDTFYNNGLLTKPNAPVSFTADIYPLLEQFVMTSWVNEGYAAQYGYGGPNNFLKPEMLWQLASTDDTAKALRLQFFNAMRPPQPKSAVVNAWPWMYGDGVDLQNPPANGFFSITKTEYEKLRQWSQGNFIADWNPDRQNPQHLEQIPLAEQPATLDKAAMFYCLGGAFHPGCEITWPMRRPILYRSAFRINERSANDPEPDYGDELTPEDILLPDGTDNPNGPLAASSAGDLTRWMAIPWQTDTASCRSGYDTKYDPYTPTFWPATVPNHVLTEADYQIVINPAVDRNTRLKHFRTRQNWIRVLGGGGYMKEIAAMVDRYGIIGVVEARPGVENDPELPPVMYVEKLGKPQEEKTVKQLETRKGSGKALKAASTSVNPQITDAVATEQTYDFSDVEVSDALPKVTRHSAHFAALKKQRRD